MNEKKTLCEVTNWNFYPFEYKSAKETAQPSFEAVPNDNGGSIEADNVLFYFFFE